VFSIKDRIRKEIEEKLMLRFKHWCLNIVLLILSVISILVVAEVITRLVYPYPTEYELRYCLRTDDNAGYDLPENFAPRWYRIKGYKYKIWTNELGCFDIPYNGEKNYILLVGDSFIWGFSAFEHKCGTVMEKHLGYRVLKCGVTAYGTKQELIKAKKIIEKTKNPPKLIIVGYCVPHDCIDDFLFPQYAIIDGYFVRKINVDKLTGDKKIVPESECKEKIKELNKCPSASAIEKIKWWVRKRSVLYKIIRTNNIVRLIGVKLGLFNKPPPFQPYETLFKIEKYPWLKEAWEENLKNLKEFKELANKYGAKLLIVLIPTREEVYDFLRRPGDYDWEGANKMISGLLKEEGMGYLDLTPLFRKYANPKPREELNSKDFYWQEDGHWNIRGNRLAGLLIAKYVIEHGLIEITDRDNKKTWIEEEISKFSINQ